VKHDCAILVVFLKMIDITAMSIPWGLKIGRVQADKVAEGSIPFSICPNPSQLIMTIVHKTAHNNNNNLSYGVHYLDVV